MNRLFFFLFFLFNLTLFADTNGIYDIRGSSPQLDANLTTFLDIWRHDTITPIQEGNYTNVRVNGKADAKRVALTFDDSPDENNTDKVLDILKHYQVQAGFFMIGQAMEDLNATAVTRASNEGHLVLNHSFTHPRLSALSSEEVAYELNTTSERINTLTGHYPLLMRPPYGSINQKTVDTINAQGFTAILWSLDSLDWALQDKNAIIENVITHVRNGDIILMHSGRANNSSVEALPEIIEKLTEMGYSFLRLDELLGIRAYR
ncbi:polysaccharide deacetylase family protein [Sulfuricurvum sp.]|uniref:polysaccharide deacetylase family protein n=1 Tax=Sulfuricurvum sp. TaxID=2025608 RepID=UPI0035672792